MPVSATLCPPDGASKANDPRMKSCGSGRATLASDLKGKNLALYGTERVQPHSFFMGTEWRLSERLHTVLVVEDEPWIHMALVHHLEDRGFAVLEASSVREAMTVLLEPAAVDLVFTDIRLSGEGDGIALARWVATNRPGIPVMLTSGEMGHVKGLTELCQAEGFTFLGKPYAHEEISARMRALVQKKQG
jgi:CheY-like chemotaxis protein